MGAGSRKKREEVTYLVHVYLRVVQQLLPMIMKQKDSNHNILKMHSHFQLFGKFAKISMFIASCKRNWLCAVLVGGGIGSCDFWGRGGRIM